MVVPIDKLTPVEFSKYNALHKWECGTKDRRGRVLGSRDRLMEIPERRVLLAQERISFEGKSVVEFGCLEGVHTISLCRMAETVTAIDGRKDNLEKTKTRCELYGASPILKEMNFDKEIPEPGDVYFHSGVFYHLIDPVGHLIKISKLCKELFLDTHYAKAPTLSYRSADKNDYLCKVIPESSHPRSGMDRFARWISKDTLLFILKKLFKEVEVLRDERERNGPRISIVASGRPEVQDAAPASKAEKK